MSLNAPYGAPCFLSRGDGTVEAGESVDAVLMHLMALRAF